MLSALLAPVSMLAQDVRTGKLGGVCSLDRGNPSFSLTGNTGRNTGGNTDGISGAAGDADGTAPEGAHCDLCASLCLAAPAVASLVLPSHPGSDVAAVYQRADVPAFIKGLRYSRGPPFTL